MSNTSFFPGFDQFASNFVRHSMLSDDFSKRRPVGPATGRSLLFERPYDSIPGNQSANDTLRHFLMDNGYEYINHLGEVWFLFRGVWHNCVNVVKDGFMRFFMLEYELG